MMINQGQEGETSVSFLCFKGMKSKETRMYILGFLCTFFVYVLAFSHIGEAEWMKQTGPHLLPSIFKGNIGWV